MNKKKLSKRRNTISTKMIIFFLFVLICLISVGYSTYTTTLKINTKVTLKGKTVDDDMPVEFIPNTVGGIDFVDFSVSEDVLSLQNQYISGDTFFVEYKSLTQTGKPREMNFNLNFLNLSEYEYTNGSVEYECSGNVSFISQQPTYTVTSTISPNESRKF